MPNELQNLITGLQMTDPRLYQFLMSLLGNLTDIEDELHPIQEQLAAIIAPAPIPGLPEIFYHEFLYNPGNTQSHAIRFNWINSDVNAVQHEIRVRPLNDLNDFWDSAAFVFRSPYNSGIIDPVPTGLTRFLIKAINVEGEYSASTTAVNVIVHPMGAPTLLTLVQGSTVMLSWTNPFSQWLIAQHELARDGVVIGLMSGSTNFISFPQQSAGLYIYRLRSKNVMGEWSPYVYARVRVLLKPYYDLRAGQSSIFEPYVGGGFTVSTTTFDNAVVSGSEYDPADGLYRYPRLITGPTDGETWEDHFITNGWASFDDADTGIVAFDYYFQPASSGFFREVTDFGSLQPADVIVVIRHSYQEVAGTVTVTFETEFSTDGATWTAPVTGDYAIPKLPFQYTRVKAIFTISNTTDGFWFFNFGADLATRTDMLRPAQITGNEDDYAPGRTYVLFLDSDGDYDITGLEAPELDAEERIIVNTGANNLTLKHEDGGSIAANRFTGQGSADILLKSGFAARLVYDMLALRWLMVAE